MKIRLLKNCTGRHGEMPAGTVLTARDREAKRLIQAGLATPHHGPAPAATTADRQADGVPKPKRGGTRKKSADT